MHNLITRILGPVLALALLSGIITAQFDQPLAAKAVQAAAPPSISSTALRLTGATIVRTDPNGRFRADWIVPPLRV